MSQRRPRKHDEKHLEFIRSLPCCICLNNISTEAAHLRFSCARVAKVNSGIGAKPDDAWTVPLCNEHHTLQHNVGDELAFWDAQGVEPIFLALALYQASGDHERGTQIVANATQKIAA